MSLMNRLFQRLTHSRSYRPRRDNSFSPFGFQVAQVETLENRQLLSALTVTTAADNGAGTLRAEIAAAHKGDTIVFNIPKSDPGYNASTGVWTITLTSGELDITKNLTITGPGAANLTISGNHTSRVFELSSKTKPQVSLSGMTISNGVGVFAADSSQANDGNGGAILNDGTLTISDSILSGNSAGKNDFGGAIENNGTLTVDGCTLTGNSAGNSAPAGINGYGGAIANFGTLTVSASLLSVSLLSNNSAAIGGGIFNVGTATVNSGTTLSSNSALEGGGIFNQSGVLTIDGCALSGNSATNGGGIFNDGKVTLTNYTTLSGNSATAYGGGYEAGNTGTLTVKNHSSITGNSAPASFGPDVYNLGVLYWDGTGSLGSWNGNHYILT
jgi:hypothetical protein